MKGFPTFPGAGSLFPRRSIAGLVFVALAASGLATAAVASDKATKKIELLPLEDFYADPLISGVSLSPDGRHLLGLKNIKGESLVMVYDLEKGSAFYPIKSDNKKFKFNWVSWANNERILLSIRFNDRGGLNLHSSMRFSETRLLSMDALKPSEMVNLYRPDKELARRGFVSQFQDNVISYLPDDPEHILVSVDRDTPLHQSVYKVDVYTGVMSMVKRGLSNVSWMADRQGVVRLGEDFDDKTRTDTIRVLDPKTNEWVDAWSYVQFKDPGIIPLGFGNSPNELYLLADKDGRLAVYKADLSKPGYPKTLVLSDPDYDVGGRLIYSRALKKVVGIYANKPVFWDPDFKAFQAGLDKALPDTRNDIVSLSSDDRKYIVFSSSDTVPGTIYYGNRDTHQLMHIADILPALTPDVLVEKELRTYKARDGLKLEGYLSLPKSFSGKPVATIILPHGGPIASDDDEFDRFSAFMVNRGYAVFQPNFRGSSGYGHDFMMQAVGGYGLQMQDDLEDAVKYLIDEHIADPKRVGIVGASYGGYAALMGATKTPDLFKCGVSFAGMSDLVAMYRSFSHYKLKNTYREQFGNDKDQLKETSPIRMVDRIKIPILLIHGDQDASVPVSQSRRMAKALKKANKKYQYVELEGATHHLDYLPDRKKTFEAIEKFLSKNLPAK